MIPSDINNNVGKTEVVRCVAVTPIKILSIKNITIKTLTTTLAVDSHSPVVRFLFVTNDTSRAGTNE